MKRQSHYLRGNKTSESVSDAIWVDTETNAIKVGKDEYRHELMQGMAVYRRTARKEEWTKPLWARFTTIDEFWDWVEDRLHGKTRLYLFAHNWAFDAPVLDVFNELPNRGWKLISAVINSPPIILRWRKPPYTIQIVDTLNIWRMPLKKVGESVGLPKLEMPKEGAPQEEWDTYNERDVEIIMEACLKWWRFLKSNDLGGFACTVAAQALRTYRHKFMRHKIVIDDNEGACALAREALHGGRCECFFIGKVPTVVHKLDINSQYPAIMANEYLPARIIGHYQDVTFSELTDWVENYCVTARVRIKTDQPVYAVVHNKRLVFPVGEFITVLSTPEIAYALSQGHITAIMDGAVYEREILFKEYVEYFYAYRQDCIAAGNQADADNAKHLLTNLYGKFAQKGMYFTKVGTTTDRNIRIWLDTNEVTDEEWHMRQYAGIIEQQEQEPESRDSHPAIAAHITAHGRIQIWKLMQGAGHGDYCYCDTDSLWCNEEGAANLTHLYHPTSLGRLKVEGIHSNVIIHGPKDYYIDGVTKIKGIRKTASCLEPGLYEQEKFTTLIGLLRRGDLTAPIVQRITKRLRREYTKGIVSKTGAVSPLTLSLE